MRVALLGLAFLAVASALYIPADDVPDRADQKRFIESWVEKAKDLLPSKEDIDKLKDTLKDQLEAAKDKFEDLKPSQEDLDKLKEKLKNATNTLKEKLDSAKDTLKEKLQGEKDDQKRFIESWVEKVKDQVKDLLPSQSDIDKLKGQMDGVFPAIDNAAAGEVKKLFKTVEDQTKTVDQFKDLFTSLDDEKTLVDKFQKLYKFEDKDGKFIGVKNWVSNAVSKVEQYYKGVVPTDIMDKIMEVKDAAEDKTDSSRLPSAVLKLFCELLQMVGMLVINYAIGLPL